MNERDTSKPADISWFTKSTLRFTPLILELMVIATVIRLIGLIEPFVFQTLIDRVLPFQRTASLNLILVILTCSTLFSATLGYLSSLLGARISNALTHRFGERIFSHSLSLPTLFLQRFHVGEMLARISEVDNIKTFMTSTLTELVIDLLFAIIYILALYAISPTLTLILLVMLPLQILSFAVFGPFIRKRMQVSFFATATQESRLVEAFGNPIVVKSLSSEKLQSDRLTDVLGQTLNAAWEVTKIISASEAFGNILRGMSVVLIIFYGSNLVFQGQLTFGQLVAFHLLSQNVAGPILSLSKIWEKWQELRISRLRLGDLLNEGSEVDKGLPSLSAKVGGALETNNLSFSYAEGREILSSVSLSFPAYQTSVITGDSGCGKSTLAKILCGLYPPTKGEVLFGGQDLSDHDPASIRRRIAYVAQEPILFSGTILDNLLMANPNATPDAIDTALKQAEAFSFVNKIPHGLAAEVGERGSFLSGGQRQRVAIARSLLSNPDVIVLDEPTSSLDEENSRKVMETLASLSSDKTIIIITHRPELVKGKVQINDLNRATTSRT
jgi:ATP-binding cassette, subfamily B, bacterial HlyB/CyaB